jgi:NADH-quinone oxidoreductase subunit E
LQEDLSQILAPYRGEKGAAITALQKVQDKLGYLPEEAMTAIAHTLGVSRNELYGVATFYSQFRFERQGKHTIRVCCGTACHVHGSPRITETMEQELGIHSGETTADYEFSLQEVACVGACALAPVMVVDKAVYGKIDSVKARKVLGKYMPGNED